MSRPTRFRSVHGRPLRARTPVLSMACAALVALVAMPSASAAQARPAPPSGPAGDPAMRADFMDREMMMRAQDASTLLTVTGEGRIEAPSDRARVSLAVVTEGESAREAANANATTMDGLTAAVRDVGGGAPGFEIRTRDFSVYPVYSTVDRPDREIVGYSVQNTLEVTVDDVLLVGEILDAALGAGANRVAGLQFEIADPAPLRREALQAAVANAREEAEAIAEALGMVVGDAVEIQGGADPTFPFRAPMAVPAMALREAVPVEPGSQTVSANVTVQYRLDPRP